MGTVGTGFSMSLDGFIAGPNDGPEWPLGDGGERLFAWYFDGDTEYTMPGGGITLEVSRTSAVTDSLVAGPRTALGSYEHGRGERHDEDL